MSTKINGLVYNKLILARDKVADAVKLIREGGGQGEVKLDESIEFTIRQLEEDIKLLKDIFLPLPVSE